MEDRRLQDERVARWDAFVAASTEEEQIKWAGMIDATVQAAHASGMKNFGPSAAKELLIALVDLNEKLDQDFKRQKALRSNRNALRFT